MELLPYRREAAETYARYWAYGRNPDFYDYETIGGHLRRNRRYEFYAYLWLVLYQCRR